MTYNLSEETKRINEADADFEMYDNSFVEKGFVAIVVSKGDFNKENAIKLTELGYTYAGRYSKSEDSELFTIPIEVLEGLRSSSQEPPEIDDLEVRV